MWFSDVCYSIDQMLRKSYEWGTIGMDIEPFEGMTMDAKLMRVAWSVVDETPLPRQRNLSLGDRFGALRQAVENQATLSPQERQEIQDYLAERQHLITELYQ